MKWFKRNKQKKKDAAALAELKKVPEFLRNKGYSFDGAYMHTDKFVKILPIQKMVPVQPGVVQLSQTGMLLLAEKNRKTNLFRFGMRIDEREIVSPEMDEKDFREKIEQFEQELGVKEPKPSENEEKKSK